MIIHLFDGLKQMDGLVRSISGPPAMWTPWPQGALREFLGLSLAGPKPFEIVRASQRRRVACFRRFHICGWTKARSPME